MESKDFVIYEKNNEIYSMNMKFDNFFKKIITFYDWWW